MTTPIDAILSEVAVATLERLAFIFASPASAAAWPPPEELLAARLEFSGPFGGEMRIAMSHAAVEELAANMLGLSDGEAPGEAARADALKELLNVICGNLLPAIAGEAAEFNLASPCLAPPAPPPPGEPAAVWIRLALDNGVCLLGLRMAAAGTRAGAGQEAK
jgi:hypothetical protein